MKKIFVLFSAVFAAVGLVSAAPVSADEAMAAANIWAAENAAFGAGVRAVSVLTVCDTNQAKTVLWHQVSMTGGGCLMMAPVTEIEPVVAALQDDPGELPDAHPLRGILSFDMRNRLRFLGLYAEDRRAVSSRLGMAAGGGTIRSDEELTVAGEWGAKQNAKWTRLLGRAAALPKALKVDAKQGVVDPVPIEIGIVKGFEKNGPLTHWNQGNAAAGGLCYNLYTPSHAVCGCVATAMSAVMQYFACQGVCKMGEGGPEVITDPAEAPSSEYCTFNGKSLGSLSCIGYAAEEGSDPTFAYDWTIFDEFTSLHDYQDSSKMDEAHRELLGRVAYNAGVMVNMGWTSSSSGAFSLEVVNALRDAFGFTDARYVDNITQDQYSKLIYQQCWAGRPVIMCIDGHEVVAVGYGKDGDGVDRVRVFLGWGGKGDAWYALPYIETASIPGGPVYLSQTVADVITMMSVDGSGTYPVCGRVMPAVSVDVDCDGQTVKSNGNGYFGVFAAAGAKVDVSCQGCSTSVEVGEEVKGGEVKHTCILSGGGTAKRTCKYEFNGESLCDAIPGSFLLPLVTFETAVTTPKAQEQALAADKLILAYSDPDSLAGLAVFNVIKKLSEENYCDCTNRYVFIALSYSKYSVFEFNPATPITQSDYNGTSYGVFDPEIFVPANRWAFTNGRLEYSRMCDYTLDEDGNPVATPETEAAIKAVIAGGWEQHLRRTSTIRLAVSGLPDGVSPAWTYRFPEDCVDGVYAGITNGEEVALSVQMYVTNEVFGTISKCRGWSVYEYDPVTETYADEPVAIGDGNSGSFIAASDDTYYVWDWYWVTDQVRVKVDVATAADGNKKAAVTKVTSGDELLDGNSVWCAAGDVVTFTVEAETEPVKYVLDDSSWEIAYPDPESVTYTTEVSEDGTSGTITVEAGNMSVDVVVYPHSSKKVQLTVASQPKACAFGDPDPAYGVAYHYDNLHKAELASDTVVSGGITWKCIGWELSGASSGSGDGSEANFTLGGTSTLMWKWGIDLTAMVPGEWKDDPSTEEVTVLGKLPEGIGPEEIEFTDVPMGWQATPKVVDGKLVAELQVNAEVWAQEKSGVDLTIQHLVGSDEITTECGIAVGEGELTITAPDSYVDKDAGLIYEPTSWIAKDGSDVELASGIGGTATIPAAEGDTVVLTWTWTAVAVRIRASIDGFVNGSDYSERFSLNQNEVWCDFGETAEFTIAIDNSPASYKFALKDWDTGVSTAYEKDYLTIRVTAQESDGPVTVTAFFDLGKTYTNLTYAACTNDVQVESAFGSPTPAYGAYYTDGKFWNNQMLAKMDILVYTNIVTVEDAEATNVWELTGWELRNGASVYQSGTGDTANFRVTADNSVFVWKWQLQPASEPEPERGNPVPPLGPGDSSPMTFSDDAINFNIANTVNGWWYGVYSKTDLADASEPWVYLKGYDAGNPATNLVFSIDIDPTEPQRFYKIKLTEDEPVEE